MYRDFYPERVSFAQHRLQVSDIHNLYIEECGNPQGIPVIWCHGGPGSGCYPSHGRQFDPAYYRVILFDQRGSGKSTPFADIRENTTHDLIEDMEKIRAHLGIDRWVVAGRSWGTTLSLLYAQKHPQHVAALFLVAVFLCDKRANQWLFQDGASHVYPEAWSDFEAIVPPEQRTDMFGAYRRMLFGDDRSLGEKAACAWSMWEAHTLSVLPDPSLIDTLSAPDAMLSLARLECHYLGHNGFIQEGQILRDAPKIAPIPATIIHGRHDMNCLYDNAWRLHKVLPASELVTVEMGGHASNDPATIDAQVKAADALRMSRLAVSDRSIIRPQGGPHLGNYRLHN